MRENVDHVFIVTGKYHQELSEYFKNDNVTIIFNKHHELGMFSSILLGVKASKDFNNDADILIIPGDCPFVSQETYLKILNGTKEIRIPAYKGKNGHPIYISSKESNNLLEKDASYNLKLFRNERDYEIIDVDDKHILIDVDTLEDFSNLKKYLRGN